MNTWTRQLYLTLRPPLTAALLITAAASVAPIPASLRPGPQHLAFCQQQDELSGHPTQPTVELGVVNLSVSGSAHQGPTNQDTGEVVAEATVAHDAANMFDSAIYRKMHQMRHGELDWEPPRLRLG